MKKIQRAVDLTEEEGAEDVDTIGGFIVTLAGRVPSRNELIVGPGNLEFEDRLFRRFDGKLVPEITGNTNL